MLIQTNCRSFLKHKQACKVLFHSALTALAPVVPEPRKAKRDLQKSRSLAGNTLHVITPVVYPHAGITAFTPSEPQDFRTARRRLIDLAG